MTLIPFRISATEYSLYVGLDNRSIERCRAYDPAQVDTRKLDVPGSTAWSRMRLRMVIVGVLTDADVTEVLEIIERGGDVMTALKRLTRGFTFRPEEGDHDGPALSLVDRGEAKH
jgi:hypothetical protein